MLDPCAEAIASLDRLQQQIISEVLPGDYRDGLAAGVKIALDALRDWREVANGVNGSRSEPVSAGKTPLR